MNILDENSKRIVARTVCINKPKKKGFLFNPTFNCNGTLLYRYEESDKNLIERIKKNLLAMDLNLYIPNIEYSKYRHMWE